MDRIGDLREGLRRAVDEEPVCGFLRVRDLYQPRNATLVGRGGFFGREVVLDEFCDLVWCHGLIVFLKHFIQVDNLVASASLYGTV